MKSHILVCWILGVVLVQWQAQLLATPDAWALFGLALAVLLLSQFIRKQLAWRWLSGTAALLLGLAYATLYAQQGLQQVLPTAWEQRDIQVRGVVESLPHVTPQGVRFQLRVEAHDTDLNNFPKHLSLGWYEEAAASRLRAAQRWQMTVRLKQPHGTANPGGFDYERWLFEEGIRAQGSVRNAPAAQLVTEFTGDPAASLQRARQWLRARIQQALVNHDGARRYSGVLVALVLGDQRALTQDDWTLFNQTGVGHLVAISGLHITLLASLAAWLANLIWRKVGLSYSFTRRIAAQKVAILVGVIVAFAYCLLAGWGVPAQRTFFMLAVFGWHLWRERLPQVWPVMLWAATFVLAWDPLACLAPGFILSFGAASVLLWLAQGELTVQEEPGGQAEFAAHVPAFKPLPWLRRARDGLWWAARLQLAITLALTPLTLAYFQQVSLVGPLANALAIPLLSWVVTPLAMLGSLCLMLGNWNGLLLLAHELVAQLVQFLQALATQPSAVYSAAVPPLWATALAMVGVLWVLLPLRPAVRWLGICLLLPALLTPAAMPRAPTWRMMALDVGQGTAVLIQTAHHVLLYDTGPRYSSETDAAERVLLPYLRYQGLGQLDALVVSHKDSDHAGGLDSVWHGVPVEKFYTSLQATEVSPQIATSGRMQACVAGQRWEWDGVYFEFLHPEAEHRYASTNEKSCVLKIFHASSGQSVLLTGDIPEKIERQLLQGDLTRLRSTVLVVPHHGSATSSSAAFIAAAQAHWAVFQAGYKNQFQHPRPEVLARYENAGSQIIETATQGAVQFDFTGTAVHVQSWRKQHCRYWQAGCGTE